MKFVIEASSDVGSVRTKNEDMVLIGSHLFRDDHFECAVELAGDPFFLAVADGMGGHELGEIASETVLRKMQELLALLPPGLEEPDLKEFLTGQIRAIHDALNAYAAERQLSRGLGSTFVGLLHYNRKQYLINIGDSRLYRLRGAILAQLSNDHSLSNLLNDPNIPQNQLANSFGGNVTSIFFDLEEVVLFAGDVLLLCSDGLSNEIDQTALEDLLAEHDGVSQLVELAKNNGGRDNISCIKVTVV